ncbi:MAG: hypothetical protein HY957_10815 [Nitrospirae bacterium]|nr:hypothetical protein [Nitrospirota bacterium]
MDKEAILLDLVKETRQTIRDIQARVYNLSTTFVVFSFAITAFAWKEAKSFIVPITVFSDIMISIILIYLYIRIYREHKFVRLALEKQESVLIQLLDGRSVSSQDVVAAILDMNKKPTFSITREVDLFLWSAGIIIIKVVIVIALN